ncbi:MAG: hypothetical protein E7461_00575 [Ruminococcaceae bacterium]|nr:hypothetical protein [Oscillospiraceae bacterium]
MADRNYTIVFPSPSLGPRYLSAIEFFQCGTRPLCHFSSLPSCAFPLAREEAEGLLKHIKAELPPYHPKFDDDGNLTNPCVLFQIVELPWLRADKEVADNG